MKNLILTVVISIITSTTISQVKFDYLLSPNENIHELSSGTIYYTSDPDTVLINGINQKAGIVYMFNDGVKEAWYIPIDNIENNEDNVVYYGETNKARYTVTYYKDDGCFTIAEVYTNLNPTLFLYFHNTNSENRLQLSDFTSN